MIGRTRAVLSITTLVAQLVLVPAARATDPPTVWFPVGPGAEGSIFAKATTGDPFEIHSSGPTRMEFARITVDPGGTTGLVSLSGTTVTLVAEGVATVVSAGATTCAGRTVSAGFAVIETDGSGTEFRNEGPSPLRLYTVTFAPNGPAGAAAPLSAEACPATTPRHATVAQFGQVVIDAPVTVESKGLSDVYVGGARLAGLGTIPWHIQPRELLGGVSQGTVTVDLDFPDRCQTGVYPVGAGFLEPAQTAHIVRNEMTAPAAFYYIAFAPTPIPFLAPAPPPGQCEGS